MLNTLGSAKTVVFYILGFNILLIALMATIGPGISLLASGIIIAISVWSFPTLVRKAENYIATLA